MLSMLTGRWFHDDSLPTRTTAQLRAAGDALASKAQQLANRPTQAVCLCGRRKPHPHGTQSYPAGALFQQRD